VSSSVRRTALQAELAERSRSRISVAVIGHLGVCVVEDERGNRTVHVRCIAPGTPGTRDRVGERVLLQDKKNNDRRRERRRIARAATARASKTTLLRQDRNNVRRRERTRAARAAAVAARHAEKGAVAA
jgi:hypothetical protein